MDVKCENKMLGSLFVKRIGQFNFTFRATTLMLFTVNIYLILPVFKEL